MANSKADRSDATILRDMVGGDSEAFELFCQREIPALVQIQRARCQRLGVPGHMAEDIIGDALLRAVRWIEDHPGENLSRNWLLAVARNTMTDWLRHRRVERRAVNFPVETLVAANVNPGAVNEILEYFAKLRPKEREILELVLLQDLSVPEAAARLNIKEWSAYKRYERALKRLRDLLDEVVVTGRS